jgi:hypothetical protein
LSRPAGRADAEECDLTRTERLARGRPDAFSKIAEQFVVEVGNGTATLADERWWAWS